jgi:hypothetical protein
MYKENLTMPQMTILDSEYATLWYYPEPKIVRHVFHKFIYGEEFRTVLNKGAEIFHQYGAKKWLSDDRNNSALPTADTEWAMTDWFPRVFAFGWKYWAIVMPDKVVGQFNMNRFMKRYIDEGLSIQVFDDPDEAMKWLESLD